MALPKQVYKINFAQGLDRKSDPFQVAPGRFLALSNSIFDEIGLLKKRGGFGSLTSTSSAALALSTFGGNLLSIGTSIQAYSSPSGTWVDKGGIHPVTLTVLPALRAALNLTQCDAAVASNGLACVVSSASAGGYYYSVLDATTGQALINQTAITATTAPRVFVLGRFFVVVYGAASNHLTYIAINLNTLAVSAPVDLSTQYSQTSTGNFDGVVANNSLYLAFNGTDGGSAIRMTYLDQNLTQHNTLVTATYVATHMSVCADTAGSTPVIWATFYDSATDAGYAMAVNPQLSSVLAPTSFTTGVALKNVTAVASSAILTVFEEVSNAYSFDSTIKTNLIKTLTVTQAGSASSATTLTRSVGLASKAFIVGGSAYVLATQSSTFQPSYFLLNASGATIARLAYQNGGGYLIAGLPSVSVSGTTATLPYLVKDLIQAVNKTQGVANTAGVYAQQGVNLATYDLAPASVSTAELGANLHVTGGILWAYDGTAAVEQNFLLYPENIKTTTATTLGNMSAQIYYYAVTYEWQDNQGNIHRSAPSVPVIADMHSSGTSTNKVTLDIPTLRLTYKTNVKIVIYRWSTAQQSYYRVTSITAPTLNDTTADSIQFVDTLADASILGNDLIYTTGGVIEDTSPPAISALTVFQARLVGINAEDPYQVVYSKQVVEASPVELSDLFTIYIAPQLIGREPSGPCRAIGVMDDKLIIGRKGSFCYLTGNGPDNTGANNDFSNPVFINSAVGCENQASIAMIPEGLMFQAAAGKGIWLLGRDLSMNYIGAPVEAFNAFTISSATVVPGTNQVRFGLQGTRKTLVYDYFMKQWATFDNPEQVSACLFQNLHAYLGASGTVYQETPGTYLDGTSPVLMSFTTGWMSLNGLQGYERAYEMSLLGQWVSPHKLSIGIAYDYAVAPSQVVVISPDNFQAGWGGEALWGSGGVWGGSSLEQWRIFFDNQKIQTFQITVQESFDPSYGVPAGEGFTLSGLNLVFGAKKGNAPRPAKYSAG